METTVLTEADVDKNTFYARDEILTPRDIVAITSTCLAKWRYNYDNAEEKDSDKIRLGAAAHSIMLSPEKFKAKYYRMPEKSDYQEGELLTSVAAMQGWLKDQGVAGRTNKDPLELAAMIHAQCEITGEHAPFIWHEIENQAAEIGRNYRMVRGNDYDAVVSMREVILSNPDYTHMIMNGEGPFYITTELAGVPVKVKLEKVIDGCIWDYTTTSDASPEFFKRNRSRVGAELHAAIMCQAYKKAFGEYPKAIYTLAQENSAPFIPEYFRATNDQLALGNARLKVALQRYKAAKERNVWPTYSGGKMNDFDVPEWEKKQNPEIFNKGE